MKRYAELIGNYKNIRIKSLIDNKLNESINAKSLNFTATALDNANKTYKIKGFGTTPSQITAELFNPTEG